MGADSDAGAGRRLGALSTDYLNRFVEAAFLLDLAIDEPQVLSAVLPWQDVGYLSYFRQSSVVAAEEAIALYHALSPSCQAMLDEATHALNKATATALEAMESAGSQEERRRCHAIVKPPLLAQIAQAQTLANGRSEQDLITTAST